MNEKALAIIALAIILIMAGLSAGFYYLGDKNGYQRANEETTKTTSLLIEKVRLEEEANHAKHLRDLAEYEKEKRRDMSKMSELQGRLREIEAANPAKPDAAVCGDSDTRDRVIGLLNKAIDSPSLPQATDIPDALRKEASITTHMLYGIEEYNDCANQLNTLIDTLE